MPGRIEARFEQGKVGINGAGWIDLSEKGLASLQAAVRIAVDTERASAAKEERERIAAWLKWMGYDDLPNAVLTHQHWKDEL